MAAEVPDDVVVEFQYCVQCKLYRLRYRAHGPCAYDPAISLERALATQIQSMGRGFPFTLKGIFTAFARGDSHECQLIPDPHHSSEGLFTVTYSFRSGDKIETLPYHDCVITEQLFH